jgi:hypothetical protein
MSESMTADFVVMAIVIVSCLFVMSLLPIYIEYRVARDQRRSLFAPAVDGRHLPQAAIEAHADDADGGERLSHHVDDVLFSPRRRKERQSRWGLIGAIGEPGTAG